MSFGMMLVTALFLIVGAAAALAALQRLADASRIAKMPTSNAKELRLGEVVKLRGAARADSRGDAVSQDSCLLGQVSMEWRLGWVREREDHPAEGAPFLLDDGSGALVEIEPRGAIVRARSRIEKARELERRLDEEATLARERRGVWGKLPEHVPPAQVRRIVIQRVDPGDAITVVGRVTQDGGGDPVGMARVEAESDFRPLLVYSKAPSSLFGDRWKPLLLGVVCLLVAGATTVVSCVRQATNSPP